MSPSLWYELGNAYHGWGKLDSAVVCYQAAIANTVGYNSMNNFILFFKRIVGMTPSKYRQLALKEQQKDQME